jgi:cytidine deaminase
MTNRESQFYQLLETYPQPLRGSLQFILQNSGRLDSRYCKAVMEMQGISPAGLMVKLLPVAKLYAQTPISHFQVGAVSRARLVDGTDEFALFMGANIEFTGQTLTQTIHAEQAAVVNAWLQGAARIDAVAVSAVPCGRCRQFLFELETGCAPTVIIAQPDGDDYATAELYDLLPQAFGPKDLKIEAGLLSSRGHLPNLNLKSLPEDPLVLEALSAAARSYAPYTHNFAGCTIQMRDGKIYTGPYAENAAFNPSLSPLHTAFVRLNLDGLVTHGRITRAILVEKPTTISQRGVCELLLDSLATDIRLEYYEIR